MSIFGPTISWDPREPLPRELQRQRGNLGTRKCDTTSNKPGTTGPATLHVIKDVQAQPEKLPVVTKPMQVPDLTTEEGARNLLAPRSIEIDASIVQDTASVQVTQVFWNNSTVLIPQGTYTFPLPTGCSVTEFTCQIGSRVLKGTVKPKKEAQGAFNDHIAAGQMAGLLEQNTTEIFSATLGNIPPDTRVTVKISYITLLKYHLVSDNKNKESFSFTIPTCIASRYGQQPRFAGTATTDTKQGLTLNIKVLDSRAIHTIRSSTHKIKVEEWAEVRAANSWADLAGEQSGKVLSGQASLVQLVQGPMFLDKDFALEIEVDVDKGKAAPEAWIEHHPIDPNQPALMAILPPGLLNQISKTPPRQREILFLVDQSGSMEDKVDSLKSAMNFFLKGIPLGNKFNIARFGSTYTTWCPQSVQYSGQSLEAALAYVSSSINADMGGTEILDAVKSMLGSRDTGMWTDIIILTDGQVWRLDELLATVRDARKASGNCIRFFCLGVGEQVSHALVEGIASMGGGYAEVVPASEQNSWESKLLSMAAASVENDPIVEVKIFLETYDGKVIDCQRSAMSPCELKNLNPFVRNRVYMLFDSEMTKDFRSLMLTITLPDGTESEQRFPLQILQGRDTTIHKLAARSLLDDLEHGRSSYNMGSTEIDYSLLGDRKQIFLEQLLGHQHFDGSFEFATDEEFVRLLGQDTFDVVASLADPTLPRSIYFMIAVIVVLELHFAPQKQLWHMMHSKAFTYIKGAPERGTGHDMEAFHDALRDVRSPLDQVSLSLEQKDRKPSRQVTYSKASLYAKQAAKRLRKIFLRGQADKDPQNTHDDQTIAPGGDGTGDPQKSAPVTRQARRVIEIAPSD
ncbi:unnamed protein product [Clonostachys chloroleuca]|uniref:VWFA domain-containing protein n=1 Tax=Clonostachys chloroleuca TaxID=1926264 RepID=A0AA35VJH0_9HYPO|nr:unnamed protein product [Clonostachys chloroleuca]